MNSRTISARKVPFSRILYRDRWLVLFILPILAYYIIFKYAPLYGLQIAWKDYKLGLGITGSPWVGWKHFHTLFISQQFWRVFRNTFLLSMYSLVLGFPAPILLALLINEIKNLPYKRVAQQLIYLPHFFSWVVMSGIVFQVLSPSVGIVNNVIKAFGGNPIFFMAEVKWWPLMYTLAGIWKEVGWGTIIYLAAISGVDPEMYEASYLDGANKLQQVLHITIPSIVPTIVILLIMRIGGIMDVGFEPVFVLSTGPVMAVSDVISTYTYRLGVINVQYSQTTAMGMFTMLLNTSLLLTANWISNRATGTGIW